MPIFPTPYPHVMNALGGPSAPKHTFMVFYSNVVNGRMWCPAIKGDSRSFTDEEDCVAVESTVNKAFEGKDQPKAIFYWVGEREEWRTPQNKARVDWNVQNIPTILRIEDGKETARLVESDILDTKKLNAFIYPDGQ